MVTKEESIAQFVKQQIRKWEIPPAKSDRKPEVRIPVITPSMEPGSGGTFVAQKVAKGLGFDYFHRDIIRDIAKSAKIRASIIDTIEYDLTINTGKMPIESAVEAVIAAVKSF